MYHARELLWTVAHKFQGTPQEQAAQAALIERLNGGLQAQIASEAARATPTTATDFSLPKEETPRKDTVETVQGR